jgi:hypothetical protein
VIARAFGLHCLAFVLIAGQALADPSLNARTVTFRVLTYDDPARPIFDGRGVTVKVGTGVEFGLNPEGGQNGVDVVPVTVDIFANRIEVRSSIGPGRFLDAAFNGYVLEFATDCALFSAFEIDAKATNWPLKPSDIRTEAGALFINVAGLAYDRDSTLALNVRVADCPVS